MQKMNEKLLLDWNRSNPEKNPSGSLSAMGQWKGAKNVTHVTSSMSAQKQQEITPDLA